MKVFREKARGFTLVEVMIALSIVIIITAIAFAAMGSTRAKNNDSSIRQTFALMRSEAEVSYKGNQRSYTNVCTDIVSERNLLPNTTNYKCLDGDEGYAIEMRLSTNMYYCVDARGVGSETTATSIGATGTNCNGSSTNDCSCN